MGDIIPFPNRRGPRRRAPHQQRRRVEWRAYSPSRDASRRAITEESAITTADLANAEAVEMPEVFGAAADWRAERRTVGDWNTL